MFKTIYAIFFVLLISSCAHQKTQLLRSPSSKEVISCEYVENFDTSWFKDQLHSKQALEKYMQMAAKLKIKTQFKMAVIDVAYGENLKIEDKSNKIEFQSTDFLSNKNIISPKAGVYPHGHLVVKALLSKNGLHLFKDSKINLYTIGLNAEQNTLDFLGLKNSLKKACDDGNKIINISANPPGEADDVVTEVLFQKTLTELNQKGCLVVAAAGNEGNKNPNLLNHSNINDSFLRVAAHGPSGQESRRSNIGEISAPGEGLQIEKTEIKWSTCQDQSAIFQGTSAAAPVASVLASMIYSLLETQTKFLMKSGPEKVKTVTEIIRLSGDGPENKNINAFKAMQLVESAIQNKY